MTDLFGRIQQAIADVREKGYEPRTVVMHPTDVALLTPIAAKHFGVREADVTGEMILAMMAL